MFLAILLVANGVFLASAIIFTWDSVREQEWRAVKIGLVGVLCMIFLGGVILLVPPLRWLVAIILEILILLFLLCPRNGMDLTCQVKYNITTHAYPVQGIR